MKVMEGNWSIVVDGESHSVRASMPAVALRPKLTVYLGGAQVHQQPIYLYAGELCQIHALGHEFRIRISGYGALGRLQLLVDGVAVTATDQQIEQPTALPEKPIRTRIIETHRVQEPLGEEIREIDNSESSVRVQRRILVSREWTRSFTLEQENSTTLGGEFGIKGGGVVDLKATAEEAVRARYQLTVDEKRTYGEELTLDVDAKTRVRVVLSWKQVWQHGEIALLREGTADELRIPYRVCLGPTFDQRQIDT